MPPNEKCIFYPIFGGLGQVNLLGLGGDSSVKYLCGFTHYLITTCAGLLDKRTVFLEFFQSNGIFKPILNLRIFYCRYFNRRKIKSNGRY